MSALGERLSTAKRILIVHLGGLGDTLHQIPAIHAIRRANPRAEIEVLAGAGQASLFELFPWIDHVRFTPTRLQARDWRQLLSLRRALRERRFDVALAFWPRNTIAAWLWLSGARWRVSRSAQAEKPAALVRLVADERLDFPWFERPWAEENCTALAQAGLAEAAAPMQFGARIDPELRRKLGIGAEHDERYIHFSPFSTADRRDPPLADLAQLLNGLHAAIALPIVISIAGDARQRDRLKVLLAQLTFTPWQVFAGTLGMKEFAAVVGGSALHLGPDSGGIHMAMMLQRRLVAWFRQSSGREQRNLRHFAPPATGSMIFVSADAREDALHGLPIEDLIAAALRLLGERS